MTPRSNARRSPGATAEVHPWTTPAQLRTRLERLWERGELLAAMLRGEALFPLEIPLTRPKARDIAERFGTVMDWVEALREGSRSARGYGYELSYERVGNRVQGANDLPVAAVFPSAEDGLRFIQRGAEARRALELADRIRARRPELGDWMARRPHGLLQYEGAWERLVAVLDWFAANPRPGLYLRQLDIPGVDTKFIEAHRGLLLELLDEVLPPEAIDPAATGVRGFAQRYGLREEPALIRFRLLDASQFIHGLSDLSVPADEFARLPVPTQLDIRDVFITENRTNGLAFPARPRSMVIFGLGYGVERLGDVPWLHGVKVWYWGDIDTHGFGILNRLRAVLPHVRSLLMDRWTLEAHRDLWVEEPETKRYTGEPTHLTPEEHALFDDLRHDRLGERIRLEQERIGYGWVKERLARLEAEPV